MAKRGENMFDHFFADPLTIGMGAFTGFVFGFLLQKGGVTRFNVIVGQFLLKDFTVLKIMLTAILIGSIGLYGMKDLGVEFNLHIKTTAIFGNALGGLIFGVGMATLGYCPGTAVAALGEGSRHAIAGVLGMVVGAGLYAEAFSWVESRILSVGNFGKVTFPSLTGVSPWWFIFVLFLIAMVSFIMIGRLEKKDTRSI
jgi:uncharacterized protein